MPDCLNRQKNMGRCTCTASCGIQGMCCECLHSHLAKGQLPGCCFTPEVERTYDRSFQAFVKNRGK